MRKLILSSLVAASALLMSCSKTEEQHACIKPLPAVSIASITDATLPASFTVDDFGWMGGTLTMTVYNEDLYDMVELHNLAVGDTLLYNGSAIVVNQIEQNGDMLVINKGLEEGGADLQAYEGGTYRAIQMDDHSIYSALGQVHLPLADDFTIVDCGDFPDDPSVTISTTQKLYLESLKEGRRDFSCLNTQVQITNGEITNITRCWIP